MRVIPAAEFPNRFLVVVHDVTPLFAPQLRTIAGKLKPLLGNRFSAAVVPHWHGGPSGSSENEYCELLGCFGERLLHGWTHQREHRNGLVSLLTGQADEFRGLDAATICERVKSAQSAFVALTGQSARGFLPPAWQLPIRSTQLDSVRFVMRFHSLESCTDPHFAQRLATWSWDWGRLGCLAPGGELLARFLTRKEPARIPCIAIHPTDVRRGWFKNALRVIQQLLDEDYVAVIGEELLPNEETDT